MPSLPLFLCICTLRLPPQHFTGQWLGVRGPSRLVAGAEWEERHVSETVRDICPPVFTRLDSSLPLASPALLPAPRPPPQAELVTHSSPGLLVASSCGRSQKFLSCFSFPCPTPTDFPA